MERNAEIDGIRGWAALFVVLYHLFQESLGRVFPVLHTGPFGFVFDGQLMVLIFFILSGDALSVSFFRTGTPASTLRLVVARYFRLTFPVLVSCLAVFFLMSLGWTHNLEAARVVGRPDWLGLFIDFKPSLSHVLTYAFSGIYFDHTTAISYNPFLWTMPIELLGSMIVFLNIFLFPSLRKPLTVLGAQALFFWWFRPMFSLFLFGMMLGHLRNTGFLDDLRSRSWSWIFACLLACVIGFVSLFGESKAAFLGHCVSSLIQTERLHLLWAMAIVFLAYVSPFFLRLFRSRCSRFLGQISFPIYVVQFSVLVSFTSYGFLRLAELGLLHSGWAFGVSGASLLLCVGLAWCLVQVERRYLSWLNGFITTRILTRIGQADS